jgi:hypothetical protein
MPWRQKGEPVECEFPAARLTGHNAQHVLHIRQTHKTDVDGLHFTQNLVLTAYTEELCKVPIVGRIGLQWHALPGSM